jgi:hypothetical protein
MQNVFFCPSLTSKKLRFNHPALSKVTTTTIRIIILIILIIICKCDHTTIICKREESYLKILA